MRRNSVSKRPSPRPRRIAGPYSDYLETEHWVSLSRRLREERGECWVCKCRANLHAHHRTYVRIGQELDEDIVVLCESCHAGVHRLAKRIKCGLLTAHVHYKLRKKI